MEGRGEYMPMEQNTLLVCLAYVYKLFKKLSINELQVLQEVFFVLFFCSS